LRALAFSQLFVSNALLRFLGFVEAAAEPGFVGTHDAIRRQVIAVGNRFAAGELALGFLVVDAAHTREIGAAVGAVAGTQRSRVVALRKTGRAVGRNVVGCERGSHGILLKEGGHPARESVRASR
jgi:hypothetical protein